MSCSQKSTAKILSMNEPCSHSNNGANSNSNSVHSTPSMNTIPTFAQRSNSQANDESQYASLPVSVRPSTPVVKKLNLTNLQDKIKKSTTNLKNTHNKSKDNGEGLIEIKQSRLILPTFNMIGSASQPSLMKKHSQVEESDDDDTDRFSEIDSEEPSKITGIFANSTASNKGNHNSYATAFNAGKAGTL